MTLRSNDQATCIAVPFSTELAMEQERGDPDIVAEDMSGNTCAPPFNNARSDQPIA